MENLESHGTLQSRFPGSESHAILIWVMESDWKWKLLYLNMLQFTFISEKKTEIRAVARLKI